MDRQNIKIRRLSRPTVGGAEEWQDLRQLCCLTGNRGSAIAPERWDFFGRLWIEPYRKICPEWTYVAQNESKIVGYLTGCPDTVTFVRAKLWSFSLPLLWDICRGRYAFNRDVLRFLRQAFGFEAGPERACASETGFDLAREYPAHLHINVESDWRNAEVGRLLMQRFLADLRSAGIPAVHLYCGEEPLNFYLRCGFTKLAQVIFHGVPVYALGLRLQSGTSLDASGPLH